MLVLDTHVWIWLAGGAEPLRPDALDAIRAAAAEDRLAIAAISVWELGMLEAKGRVRLHMDVDAWVAESLRRARIRVLPLDPPVAIAASRLPGALHGDPADRLVAATARHAGGVLVTRDERLLAWARAGWVRAIEA